MESITFCLINILDNFFHNVNTFFLHGIILLGDIMKNIKIKFTLSLIFLINSIIIATFYVEHLALLEKILIPFFFIYFMIDSLFVLFPIFINGTNSSKLLNKFYNETNNYNKELLNPKIKQQNRKSLLIFLLYFGILSIIGILYINVDIFEIQYLYIIFFLVNFGDYFSILIWCPFNSIILKNTCCTRCRIKNWDRLMKFYILIFIPSIYTLILFFLGIVIFIAWEYNHYKHPERFYSLSNSTLSCKQCSSIEMCKKNKE